jgi:hypothetical protein
MKGRLILDWILVCECCLDLSGSGQGQMESSCENGSEPRGFIKIETNFWPAKGLSVSHLGVC